MGSCATVLSDGGVVSDLAVGDHSGVVDYRHDELVVTARAGTPLVELRRILASQQQMMAFDPPSFAGDGSLVFAMGIEDTALDLPTLETCLRELNAAHDAIS